MSEEIKKQEEIITEEVKKSESTIENKISNEELIGAAEKIIELEKKDNLDTNLILKEVDSLIVSEDSNKIDSLASMVKGLNDSLLKLSEKIESLEKSKKDKKEIKKGDKEEELKKEKEDSKEEPKEKDKDEDDKKKKDKKEMEKCDMKKAEELEVKEEKLEKCEKDCKCDENCKCKEQPEQKKEEIKKSEEIVEEKDETLEIMQKALDERMNDLNKSLKMALESIDGLKKENETLKKALKTPANKRQSLNNLAVIEKSVTNSCNQEALNKSQKQDILSKLYESGRKELGFDIIKYNSSGELSDTAKKAIDEFINKK